MDHDEVDTALDQLAIWIDGATWHDASPEQILALIRAFEARAGRVLSDLEIEALFTLQRRFNVSRNFIEGILTDRIYVAGRQEDGEFLYGAR